MDKQSEKGRVYAQSGELDTYDGDSKKVPSGDCNYIKARRGTQHLRIKVKERGEGTILAEV